MASVIMLIIMYDMSVEHLPCTGVFIYIWIKNREKNYFVHIWKTFSFHVENHERENIMHAFQYQNGKHVTKTLFPPSVRPLERNIENIIDSRITNMLVDVSTIWNPDECSEELLPWLAWAMSVDEWDPDWPESIKRQVIKSSSVVHRRKGTKRAILEALESLNVETSIQEWFELDEEEHTFQIVARPRTALGSAGSALFDQNFLINMTKDP